MIAVHADSIQNPEHHHNISQLAGHQFGSNGSAPVIDEILVMQLLHKKQGPTAAEVTDPWHGSCWSHSVTQGEHQRSFRVCSRKGSEDNER
jgi:hypothetical protein